MQASKHEDQRLLPICCENCKLTENEHDQLIENILATAKAEGREEVLDSYRKSVLRNYVCRRNGSMSARKMFTFLRDAVDSRKEIHELERNMDKEHFIELVTGGYLMAGGVDKATNLPIFWFRMGLLDRGSWRYKYGSPRANAYVRYVLCK